jgi:protein involved in polysaccharide export with SLBB domain
LARCPIWIKKIRSTSRIESAIREKLTTLSEISSVRVVVSVVEYRPIFVLGFVNNPGRYPYSARTTVLQAMALAGGIGNPLNVFAASSRRTTRRAGPKQSVR